MKTKLKETFLTISTVILTGALFYVMYESSFLFLSALVGIGISSLITPLIININKKFKIPKYLSAVFLISFSMILFIVLFWIIGNVTVDQLDTLKSKWPQIIEFWKKKWLYFNQELPYLQEILKSNDSEDFTKVLFKYTQNTFANLVKFGTGLTLALVIALFTSIRSEFYKEGLIKLLPTPYQKDVRNRLHIASITLQKWFQAQLIDLIIVGALTSMGLWLLGVKYWALYGLMTCVFSFIPYAGILIVVVMSSAITLVLQPHLIAFHLGVFFLVQQIEANLILPKLMKKHTEIPSALLVFVLLLAGIWLGFLGAFLATPLLAVIVGQYKSRNLPPKAIG